MRDLAQILRELKSVRDRKDALKAQSNEAQKAIDALTNEASEAYEAMGASSITLEIGGQEYRAGQRVTKYCSLEDPVAFGAWCEANDLQAIAIYAPNASKLKSLYKERDEDGDSLPEGVRTYEKIGISFTRKKG